MSTHEERVAAATVVRELITSGAGAQLRALPGVHHVSAGLKHRGGKLTRELCIRVYVREKRPDDQLSPAERVPREIDGVPTDVNVFNTRFHVQEDRTRYRPVKGGTLISNGILALQPDGKPRQEEGTFGITATRNSDQDVMLLSCYHVLMANGARIGSPIFQPTPDPNPLLRPEDIPWHPDDDTHKIAEISKFAINSKVDAAIARLDVSSCCRSCGIDWRDEIPDLSKDGVPPSNKLLGLRRAEFDDLVYKFGMTSYRTEGRVFDPDLPEFTLDVLGTQVTFKDQIGIESTDGLVPFSLKGDSGSAIVDSDGFIVGLLFASNDMWGGGDVTAANHITDVCSALGITINLDRSTHDTAGAPMPAHLIRPTDADVALYPAARARLLAHPAGEWIWALANTHREEVVELVRRHRPVTVAWHRAGGPALFALALKTLRAGGDTLPAPPDGSTLEAALARVGDALSKHGSPALRAAINRYRTQLLAAVRESTTVTELLEKLRPVALANVRELVSVGTASEHE
jgi:hypothetical protein